MRPGPQPVGDGEYKRRRCRPPVLPTMFPPGPPPACSGARPPTSRRTGRRRSRRSRRRPPSRPSQHGRRWPGRRAGAGTCPGRTGRGPGGGVVQGEGLQPVGHDGEVHRRRVERADPHPVERVPVGRKYVALANSARCGQNSQPHSPARSPATSTPSPICSAAPPSGVIRAASSVVANAWGDSCSAAARSRTAWPPTASGSASPCVRMRASAPEPEGLGRRRRNGTALCVTARPAPGCPGSAPHPAPPG